VLTVKPYPMVLTCEGPRCGPRQVSLIPRVAWPVDWVDGLVTLYRRDPREHLRLGYEPRHLRRQGERCE
jgi:hypothetical protein